MVIIGVRSVMIAIRMIRMMIIVVIIVMVGIRVVIIVVAGFVVAVFAPAISRMLLVSIVMRFVMHRLITV